MRYRSVENYQVDCQQVLAQYTPTLFSLRSHEKEAKNLIKELYTCRNGKSAFEKIYESYRKLMQKDSRKLAKLIALVLCKDLNIDEKNIHQYFAYREGNLRIYNSRGELVRHTYLTRKKENFVETVEEKIFSVNFARPGRDRNMTGLAIDFVENRRLTIEDPIIGKYEKLRNIFQPFSGESFSLASPD